MEYGGVWRTLFSVRRPFCFALIRFDFFFQNRVSLCNSDYPGVHSVEQVGLEFRDSSSSPFIKDGIRIVNNHHWA